MLRPNNSPTSPQRHWNRLFWRGRVGVLASIGIFGLLSSVQVAIAGDNDLETFNDLDGAFVMANGEARRSEHEGIYTEDRHYLTSARSDYLSSDWIYEVTVRSPSDGPPDILYIGIGSGRPDPTYFNEAANSLMFRIHQGWIDGRVDVAAHPTGPEFTYLAEAIGALPAPTGSDFTEFTARIAKVGNTIKFSIFNICTCPSDSELCWPDFSHEILDVSAAAPFLSSGNTYLLLGNGSGSYVFTKATITEGPANDSISGSASGSTTATGAASGSATATNSEPNVDGGGGSIDAFCLAVLALLAVAGARRRLLAPEH
jgi:hypothetical protein